MRGKLVSYLILTFVLSPICVQCSDFLPSEGDLIDYPLEGTSVFIEVTINATSSGTGDGIAFFFNYPLDNGTEVIIAPLIHFPVIKDLVVDFDKGVRRLKKMRPYVERTSNPTRPEMISKESIAIDQEEP